MLTPPFANEIITVEKGNKKQKTKKTKNSSLVFIVFAS